MPFTFDIDMASLEREWAAACEGSAKAFKDAAQRAAKAGVEEAQQNHPYTDRTQDLTNTASPVDAGGDGQHFGGDVEMTWPKEYASFVDRGTSRSRPYPYVKNAERAAKAALPDEVKVAISDLKRRAES